MSYFCTKEQNLKAFSLFLVYFSLILTNHSNAQDKIGLVLSGGGATGLAHIGVLKALEEHGIPIDFITGTSAGALVGSLYASGYSPEQIEAYVISDYFQVVASGAVEPKQEFLLRKDDANANMIGMSFSQDSILKKSLPTNFTSSTLLDFEMMRLYGTTASSNYNNFDSLFVPFRCVASDIAKKESVIFKDGYLNEAVRASMSYPFYYKPIKIDDVLLFDGGLYNNFPADVLYETFDPDYIIGSNVSYNADLPDEDDLISQLTNMLVRYSNYELPCDAGFMIEPKTEVATFDFSNAQQAITDGYEATIAQIDSLKLRIHRRIAPEELAIRRLEFHKNKIDLKVSSVTINDSNEKMKFLSRSIIKKNKNELLDLNLIEKRYFRLYSAPQIDFIYPTLKLKSDSTYDLGLKISKAKEIRLEVGGHFSSRAVNTGYIGLSYQSIGKVATKTELSSYFGKFYGSGKVKFTLELPRVYPFSTSAYFTINRWDYFRSFATFFEDAIPSFLVQEEMYAGLQVNHPFGNNIKSTIDGRWFNLENSYYQTDQFTNKDTADVTNFSGGAASWTITQNSLNRKQFASSGHYFKTTIRYINGREHSTSGSTSAEPYDIIKFHSWLNLGAEFQSFVVDKHFFHLGIHGQLAYNTHPLFANYTSTLLSTTEFSLVPDAGTYFLSEYRSPQFAGLGLNTIFTIKKKIDLRVDGYIYQPFIQIIQNDDGTQGISDLFEGRTFMASSSIIYHSFIGPIRLTLNYFPEQPEPLAFQFSLGYVLFNDRAIR
ncbi:MAG: patatin-like phospholipase family protein [Crocinitomicaceae bacterium]|nr:patatin-like phospholipase family protein [Crocinitomicaceae bacterium]